MNRKNEIHYTGLFLDLDYMWSKLEHITKGRFERVIKRPHITFLYKPTVADYSLVGTVADIIVTGYGYDDENEGVSVKIETDNKELYRLFQNIDNPHITLTVHPEGHTVNTKNLAFYPVPIVRLKATYGVVTDSGELITE